MVKGEWVRRLAAIGRRGQARDAPRVAAIGVIRKTVALLFGPEATAGRRVIRASVGSRLGTRWENALTTVSGARSARPSSAAAAVAALQDKQPRFSRGPGRRRLLFPDT